jgi:hypothetical protein
MFNLIAQYFHMPSSGSNIATWAAWVLGALFTASEYFGASDKFKNNTVVGGVVKFIAGGVKAIKFDAVNDTVTINLTALEDSHDNISVLAPVTQSPDQSAGMGTSSQPAPDSTNQDKNANA